MNANDETIYGGMPVENEENPQVVNENESKKEVPWKFVGLGAATGILMGAGALYATNAMAATTAETPDADPANPDAAAQPGAPSAAMPVAKDITSGSFEHAFAEARAQVGPGGLFQWHGGIYNTYTKEEWDALSNDQKEIFASKVHPEHPVTRINTVKITEKEPDIHIDKVELHEHKTVVINNEPKEEPENPDEDVHVVYTGSNEVTVDGKEMTVENYEVNGHKAAVVNFHDEDEHDIAIVDKNDNLQIDDAESMDTATGELLDANWEPLPDVDPNFMANNADDAAADVTVGA